MNTTIAIPSTNPGGLDAPLGTHFGHCDLYTVVKIENGKIGQVTSLPSIDHAQGGCLAPVQHLAGNGVKVLIAGGMGLRPLMGFNQVGIDVYFGGNCTTVQEAVDNFIAGQLPRFTNEYTCGGGGGHPQV